MGLPHFRHTGSFTYGSFFAHFSHTGTEEVRISKQNGQRGGKIRSRIFNAENLPQALAQAAVAHLYMVV